MTKIKNAAQSAPEASKASTVNVSPKEMMKNFKNFQLIDDFPDVDNEWKNRKQKEAPQYIRMLKETFPEFLKKQPNKKDYDRCDFLYHKEGDVIKDFDPKDSYSVCYKLERYLESAHVWFCCHIINSAGKLVYWDLVEIMNPDQYIRNVGGHIYLDDGIYTTLLSSDFYFDGEDPDDI